MDEMEHARLTAHGVLIGMLLDCLKRTNPEIEKFILANVDYVLGEQLAETGTPQEYFVKMREEITDLLEMADGKDYPEPPQKRRTLRRRFLKWLDSD